MTTRPRASPLIVAAALTLPGRLHVLVDLPAKCGELALGRWPQVPGKPEAPRRPLEVRPPGEARDLRRPCRVVRGPSAARARDEGLQRVRNGLGGAPCTGLDVCLPMVDGRFAIDHLWPGKVGGRGHVAPVRRTTEP
ncbi:MAG: hypothetical protein ACRERE_29720 [Candidatus Entotheonellia bacterium]